MKIALVSLFEVHLYNYPSMLQNSAPDANMRMVFIKYKVAKLKRIGGG